MRAWLCLITCAANLAPTVADACAALQRGVVPALPKLEVLDLAHVEEWSTFAYAAFGLGASGSNAAPETPTVTELLQRQQEPSQARGLPTFPALRDLGLSDSMKLRRGPLWHAHALLAQLTALDLSDCGEDDAHLTQV
jgi:hypothetical protein